MVKLLVLYYSMYGHTESLAEAVAEGANSVAGAAAEIKRVPELMPQEVALKAGAKLRQAAALAKPDELADYDALIIGSPTRFGNMCAQMRNFLDQTGPLWVRGALDGKVGSAFTCSGSGSGNESTILSIHNTLIHHGMLVAGISPGDKGLADVSHMRGGSVYGASSIAMADGGDRQPSDTELALARGQGKRVAEIALRLAG